jgi:rubrerythrin
MQAWDAAGVPDPTRRQTERSSRAWDRGAAAVSPVRIDAVCDGGATLASVLQTSGRMTLDWLLARCRVLEERAAAVYRTFASRSRHDPEMCAMWTALAREEATHAKALTRAAGWLDGAQGWQTRLEGWDDELDEIETRLAYAERPEIGADIDRQLVAALALERTELDTIFHRLLSILPTAGDVARSAQAHTAPLLAAAARRGGNPSVEFEAALLRAHQQLRHAS